MNLIILLVFVVLTYFLVFKASHVKQRLTLLIVILLLTFVYVSYTQVTKQIDINYSTIAGIEHGVKLYFSWLGTAFSNFKGLTGDAVKMDWGFNNDSVDKPTIQEESSK